MTTIQKAAIRKALEETEEAMNRLMRLTYDQKTVEAIGNIAEEGSRVRLIYTPMQESQKWLRAVLEDVQ